MVTQATIDNAYCDALILRQVSGDNGASRVLVEYLWPIWLQMIRSSRRMRYQSCLDDACHDVAVKLVEKLGQSESRALTLYVDWKERNPDKAFEDWLRIITQNAIRDYLRDKGITSGKKDELPSVKRLLNDFASSPLLDELGCRPPITLAQTARELLEFAKRRLPPQELQILEAWLRGESFEEMALDTGLDVEVARRSLRSSVAILRRYFSKEGDVACE